MARDMVTWKSSEERASKKGGVINAADVSSQIRLEKGVLDLVMGKKLRVLLRTILVEK